MAVCKISFENPICKLDNTFSEKKNNNLIINSFTPYICSFNRFFKLNHMKHELFEEFPCQDILHAIALLYKSNLNSMEWETLYENICDPKSFTVFLVADKQDIKQIYDLNHPKVIKNILKNKNSHIRMLEKLKAEIAAGIDHITEDNITNSNEYVDGFMATYESEDEEEDQSGLTDKTPTEFIKNTQGFKSFVKSTVECNLELINLAASGDQAKGKHIVLSRPEYHIAGACTFFVRYVNNSKRIIHIVLLSVNKVWRGYGLGKYLVNILKRNEITAAYDSIVVHAEDSAKEFFKHLDFIDDALINSQWSDFEDEFMNCKLMTYIPPFIKNSLSFDRGICIQNYEREIQRYNTDMLSAHLTQLKIIIRMKADMKLCHEKIQSQEETIKDMMQVIRQLHQDKEKLIHQVNTLREKQSDET